MLFMNMDNNALYLFDKKFEPKVSLWCWNSIIRRHCSSWQLKTNHYHLSMCCARFIIYPCQALFVFRGYVSQIKPCICLVLWQPVWFVSVEIIISSYLFLDYPWVSPIIFCVFLSAVFLFLLIRNFWLHASDIKRGENAT